MNRLAAAVALLVLASGCNAFGGASEPAPERTLTSVAVPTDGATETPTATEAPGNCVAPRPAAAPEAAPVPRATPVALPGRGGAVDGEKLARLHGRALSNYSFHLRASDSGEVWSLPRAAAFAYEGVGLGVGFPWAYAVGGRLYTLRSDGGQLVFDERTYRRGSRTRERLREVLTGERWLAEQIAPYNYTVVGTRTWNGTDVRVLREVVEGPLVVRAGGRADALRTVNSTLYVDDYGIVRRVRHVERLQYGPTSDLPNRTAVRTFAVDQVGTASVHRPAAFCVADPDAMRTATPVGAVTPTVSGGPTVTPSDGPTATRTGTATGPAAASRP